VLIGKTLSHYRITAALGAGGMGEVYRATDTKLHRDIAIKVLPAEVAQDAERLARFRREAQLLASLNHPNIAAIHGLEEVDGQLLLVLELVEGEGLDERLERGAIPVEESIELARQIAEGLEAAHENGIVHRDLKPANIKLTPEGKVKVLDFGLAKAWAGDRDFVTGSSGDLSQSPTLAHTGTQAGVILGTAAYMSPDQARGKAVDRRSDVWAFGVVLWEMLTGRQLFAGDTASDIVAAVLTREPDWGKLPASTPAPVRQLLRRALERDVRRRLQAIGEARLVLEEPDVELAGVAISSEGHSRHRAALAAVAGGLILLAAGWLLRPAPAADDPLVRKADLTTLDFEALRNRGLMPAISPDGSRVLYMTEGRLWVRDLDSFESRELPDTEGARYFFWSPDSGHVAYAREGRAWRVSVHGGQPSELGVVPEDLVGSGDGVWTPGGQVVIAGSDTVGLWEIPAEGGEGRELLTIDRQSEVDFHELGLLPEGRGILLTVHGPSGNTSIELLAGGSRRELIAPTKDDLRYPVYSPTGHLVYSRTTTSPGIWAVPFSLERLETTGAPFLVVPDGLAPSIALDGTLCFVRPRPSPLELVRVTRDGTAEVVGVLPEGMASTSGLRLSPDGTRVAIGVGSPIGHLWIYDLDRGSLSRLATDAVAIPVWTATGDRVIFPSSRDARSWNLWARRADAAGEGERLGTGEETQWPLDVSPDGRWLVFRQGADTRLFKLALDDPDEITPVFPGQARGLITRADWMHEASFSPDGRWLVYASDESGRTEIYAQPFPGGENRWQVSTEGGGIPKWGKSGEIFYLADGRLHTVAVKRRGESLVFSRPVSLFPVGGNSGLGPSYDVTADGQTFLTVRSEARARISLVFNWPRELARAAPEGSAEEQ
jgi:serine/threonine-protein kinase